MTRNVAASVHQRLLNRAHAAGRPFDELLQYFALERFLYRLGRSSYSQQFVLKGALMFGAWHGPFARPTRDVDLLGIMDNSVEHVVGAIRVICQEPVPEDDGLRRKFQAMVYLGIKEAVDFWLALACDRQVDAEVRNDAYNSLKRLVGTATANSE